MSTSSPPHRHHFPWLRIVAIVVVMAIVVSALWMVIRQVDDTDLDNLDPTAVPGSPEASPPGSPPAATPTDPATPEGELEPAWAVGSLPDLLGYAPDRLADDSLPLNDIARYADIAAWMDARGVATPASPVGAGVAEWQAELDNLAMPLSLRERGLDPAWQRAYGFNLTQVEQVLIIGQAPDYVMILKGAFDGPSLQAAWVDSGYQAVEVEGMTVWSLFPGDTVDLSAPESRPAMGTLNNVVVLDDGTLVAAAKTSRIESVLEVVNGGATSLAENDDIAALLLPGTGAEQLASAIVSKGTLLQTTTSALSTPEAVDPADSMASPAAEPRMPEVSTVLLGIPLPGSPTEATPAAGALHRLTMLLVFDDLTDAQGATDVVTNRLDRDRSPVTGEPYTMRMGAPRMSVLEGDDRAVVMVTGALLQGPADWLDLFAARDLGFAAWFPDEE